LWSSAGSFFTFLSPCDCIEEAFGWLDQHDSFASLSSHAEVLAWAMGGVVKVLSLYRWGILIQFSGLVMHAVEVFNETGSAFME